MFTASKLCPFGLVNEMMLLMRSLLLISTTLTSKVLPIGMVMRFVLLPPDSIHTKVFGWTCRIVYVVVSITLQQYE